MRLLYGGITDPGLLVERARSMLDRLIVSGNNNRIIIIFKTRRVICPYTRSRCTVSYNICSKSLKLYLYFHCWDLFNYFCPNSHLSFICLSTTLCVALSSVKATSSSQYCNENISKDTRSDYPMQREWAFLCSAVMAQLVITSSQSIGGLNNC